jgi:xanthine dehydrogenase accessory factor
VKHWHETASIMERVVRLAPSGRRAAIATVVRISGSAYRRPGAKLLVEESGDTDGGVSGGCLEADVRGVALEILAAGKEPRLLHYDTGSDEETVWGLGLGCEGAVDVLVTPADPKFCAHALELIRAGRPFAIETALPAGQSKLVAAGVEGESRTENDVFIDVLRPPPHLAIFGAGDDARPLAKLAAEVGFEVLVVDHRPAYLTEARFPRPAKLLLRRASEGVPDLGDLSRGGRRHFAVVQTHALVHDRDWLKHLLPMPLSFLGMLGPRVRGEEVLRQLGGVSSERLFTPVGLDVGADGPEQVAVSIVAEMLAVNAGRTPGHLRDRARGIHE